MDPISPRTTCTPEDLASPLPQQPSPQNVSRASTDAAIPYQAPPDERAPVGDDSRLERTIREQFAVLGQDETLELNGGVGGKAAIALDFKGKLRAERQEDGSFTVEVDSQGEGGSGVPGAAGRIGIAAGTRFHVENSAQAADLCDALLKGATVNSSSALWQGLPAALDGLHSLGVKGDLIDAQARVRSYFPKISEAKADLTGTGELGAAAKFDVGKNGPSPLGAKTTLQGRVGLSIDFEKGELRQNNSLALSADAFLKVPFAVHASGNGKATVVVSAVYKMSDEVKQALKDGRLSPAQAWALAVSKQVPDEVVVKAELEVGAKNLSGIGADLKAKMKAQSTLDLAQYQKTQDPEELRKFLQQVKWTVEGEAGVGAGLGFDLGVAKAEVSMMRKRRSKLEGKFDTGAAFNEALKLTQSGDERSIEAQRAAFSLR